MVKKETPASQACQDSQVSNVEHLYLLVTAAMIERVGKLVILQNTNMAMCLCVNSSSYIFIQILSLFLKVIIEKNPQCPYCRSEIFCVCTVLYFIQNVFQCIQGEGIDCAIRGFLRLS